MNTEKYVKAGIISGIVLVGVTIAFGIIPSFTDRYIHDVFEAKPTSISEAEVNQKFLESKEYQAFAQRFPEHETEFQYSDRQDSRFAAIAYNEETQNALILSLRYDVWDEDIDQNIQCSTMKRTSGIRYDADNFLVTPFIKSTNCLD